MTRQRKQCIIWLFLSHTSFVSTLAVAPYNGPITEKLKNCVASIPLDESGLVVEVADSIVAPGGLGLFVRCVDSTSPVTLDALTPFCGYAQGSMCMDADSECGKTVTFALHSLKSQVFFEGGLWAVGALLEKGYAFAGYRATQDASTGELTGLAADPAYDGPRFFVPSSPQPELSIMNCGQMANDLAIGVEKLGGSGDAYSSDSRAANLLALVQRVERAGDEGSESQGRGMLLRASRPISTLARTVEIANEQPMEIGCEYGAGYWGMGGK